MKDARLVLAKTSGQTTEIVIKPGFSAGGKQLMIVGGPCAVENAAQMNEVARVLSTSPVNAIRGGAFKPRTSPYAFQGLGLEGLQLLANVRRTTGLPVITEVMSEEQIAMAEPHVDVFQIGSRNMQNFELLKALGKTQKPVILKRGLAATIEEFIMCAEYIMAGGNHNVILCERGIRSFDSFARNVLDLGAVVALKQLTHLPVIVDPSHAAGKSELIPDLTLAAIACGADGVMIECHPQPEKSVSDARQALSLPEMVELVERIRPFAAARGRTVGAKPIARPSVLTTSPAVSSASPAA